ncbi:MAG: neutral zinc metallopeptidase [Ilumatobacteraceae bacterium]
MRARVMGLVGLMALVTAACGVPEPGVTATQSRQSGGGGDLFPTGSTVQGDTPPPDERTYDIIPGVVDFGSTKPEQPYDGFLTAAFGDIQQFWNDTFPESYGAAFEPLSGGIYAAYPGRSEEIPGCGSPVGSTYEDVANLGAFYCIDGDFMAYDDDSLLPSLVNDLGKEAVAVVLAHEFGHAVQARAGEWDQPGVLKEQQADCFAGAWSAHVASGASDLIQFDDADIRAGLVAMIQVRDPIDGAGLADPQAHGTGFDRVGAFQDGFEGGATRCAAFFTEGRLDNLIDIPFDISDANAGNLPLIDPNPDPTNGPKDIITLIPGSLEFFWTDLAAANGVAFTPPTLSPFDDAGPYPSCAGIDEAAYPRNVVFCAADNTIYWDQDFALELSQDPLTGDMSVGYLLSNAYSDAIQTALRSQKTGETRALFDDCLTGAWVAFIVPPIPEDRTNTLQLSAGDLDEAVITAIALSDASTDTNVRGSAFEKIDAFRTGVLGGLNVCRDSIG